MALFICDEDMSEPLEEELKGFERDIAAVNWIRLSSGFKRFFCDYNYYYSFLPPRRLRCRFFIAIFRSSSFCLVSNSKTLVM